MKQSGSDGATGDLSQDQGLGQGHLRFAVNHDIPQTPPPLQVPPRKYESSYSWSPQAREAKRSRRKATRLLNRQLCRLRKKTVKAEGRRMIPGMPAPEVPEEAIHAQEPPLHPRRYVRMRTSINGALPLHTLEGDFLCMDCYSIRLFLENFRQSIAGGHIISQQLRQNDLRNGPYNTLDNSEYGIHYA